MGCFEARADEEMYGERMRQLGEGNDNIENSSNYAEEEFEDFKEIGSKHIL